MKMGLMFAELHRKHPAPKRSGPGYAKPEPTFVDALAAVRRELWSGFLQPRTSPGRGKTHYRQSSIRCWTASATLPEIQKGKSRAEEQYGKRARVELSYRRIHSGRKARSNATALAPFRWSCYEAVLKITNLSSNTNPCNLCTRF